jgi:hypothetical protein
VTILQYCDAGLRDIPRFEWRAKGATIIEGLRVVEWREDQVRVDQHARTTQTVRFVDKKGSDVTPRRRYRTYVQDLTVSQQSWPLESVRVDIPTSKELSRSLMRRMIALEVSLVVCAIV